MTARRARRVARSGRALALAHVLLAGCAGAASEPTPSRADPALQSSARAPAPPPALKWPSELARPAAPRIVAIGDLHGDLAAARRALRLAGAIGDVEARAGAGEQNDVEGRAGAGEQNDVEARAGAGERNDVDHWRGGALVVVQTGDAIDRGDDDRAVLDLLERLHKEAQLSGGALIALSGNHELMNAAQDFRYVTPGGFAEFSGERGRADAFRPGGPYAQLLATRPIVFKVGDTLFVHGGVLQKHVAYGLGRMHEEVRAWLLGTRAEPPAIVMAEDGPIWTRVYSSAPQPADCDQLRQVLAATGTKRMVVGHTVQRTGINAACGGRVWRIDVGLSRFYGGPVQVLELRGGAVEVRSERGPSDHARAPAPP